MKSTELKELTDECIQVYNTLTAFENSCNSNTPKTREEIKYFNQAFEKLQKRTSRIYLKYNKRKSFENDIQICRLVCCMKGIEDFFEEYEILQKKYQKNKHKMTRQERLRHILLIRKIRSMSHG
ncbi:MAG: hypothetical protein O3C48_08415 [Crenarchaeota archaeon]|nr:hypothetical protein [Thermoproteota archaeon]